jgi:hypothetical protein
MASIQSRQTNVSRNKIALRVANAVSIRASSVRLLLTAVPSSLRTVSLEV